MSSIEVTTELYHDGRMLFSAYDEPMGFISHDTGVFYPLAELKAKDIDAAELELEFKGSQDKPAVYMEDVLIQHVIEGDVDVYETDIEVSDVKIDGRWAPDTLVDVCIDIIYNRWASEVSE